MVKNITKFLLCIFFVTGVANGSKTLVHMSGKTTYDSGNQNSFINVYGSIGSLVDSNWFGGLYVTAQFSKFQNYSMGTRFGKYINQNTQISTYVQFSNWISDTHHKYNRMILGTEGYTKVRTFKVHSIVNGYMDFGKGYDDVDYTKVHAIDASEKLYAPDTHYNISHLYGDGWVGVLPFKEKLEFAVGPRIFQGGIGWQMGLFYTKRYHKINYVGNVNYGTDQNNHQIIKFSVGMDLDEYDPNNFFQAPRVNKIRFEQTVSREEPIYLDPNEGKAFFVHNYDELIGALNNPAITRIVLDSNFNLPGEFNIPYGKNIFGKKAAGYTNTGRFIQYSFDEVPEGITITANTPGITMFLEGNNRLWGLNLYNINIDNTKPYTTTDSAEYSIGNNILHNGSIALMNNPSQPNQSILIQDNQFIFTEGALTGASTFEYRENANQAYTHARAVLNIFGFANGSVTLLASGNKLQATDSTVSYDFPLIALGGIFNNNELISSVKLFDDVQINGATQSTHALIYILNASSSSPLFEISLIETGNIAGIQPQYVLDAPLFRVGTIEESVHGSMSIPYLHIGNVTLGVVNQLFYVGGNSQSIASHILIDTLAIKIKNGDFTSLGMYLDQDGIVQVFNLSVNTAHGIQDALFNFNGQVIKGSVEIKQITLKNETEFKQNATLYGFQNTTVESSSHIFFPNIVVQGENLGSLIDVSGLQAHGIVNIGSITATHIESATFTPVKFDNNHQQAMLVDGTVNLGNTDGIPFTSTPPVGFTITLNSGKIYTGLQSGLLDINNAQISGTFRIYPMVYRATGTWRVGGQLATIIHIQDVHTTGGILNIGYVDATALDNTAFVPITETLIEEVDFKSNQAILMEPHVNVPVKSLYTFQNVTFDSPVTTSMTYEFLLWNDTHDYQVANQAVLFNFNGIQIPSTNVTVQFVGENNNTLRVTGSNQNITDVIGYGIDIVAPNIPTNIKGQLQLPGLSDASSTGTIEMSALVQFGYNNEITLGNNAIHWVAPITLNNTTVDTVMYVHAAAAVNTNNQIVLPDTVSVSHLGVLSDNPYKKYYFELIGNAQTIMLTGHSLILGDMNPLPNNTGFMHIQGGDFSGAIEFTEGGDFATNPSSNFLVLDEAVLIDIDFMVAPTKILRIRGNTFITRTLPQSIGGKIDLDFGSTGALQLVGGNTININEPFAGTGSQLTLDFSKGIDIPLNTNLTINRIDSVVATFNLPDNRFQDVTIQTVTNSTVKLNGDISRDFTIDTFSDPNNIITLNGIVGRNVLISSTHDSNGSGTITVNQANGSVYYGRATNNTAYTIDGNDTNVTIVLKNFQQAYLGNFVGIANFSLTLGEIPATILHGLTLGEVTAGTGYVVTFASTMQGNVDIGTINDPDQSTPYIGQINTQNVHIQGNVVLHDIHIDSFSVSGNTPATLFEIDGNFTAGTIDLHSDLWVNMQFNTPHTFSTNNIQANNIVIALNGSSEIQMGDLDAQLLAELFVTVNTNELTSFIVGNIKGNDAINITTLPPHLNPIQSTSLHTVQMGNIEGNNVNIQFGDIGIAGQNTTVQMGNIESLKTNIQFGDIGIAGQNTTLHIGSIGDGDNTGQIILGNIIGLAGDQMNIGDIGIQNRIIIANSTIPVELGSIGRHSVMTFTHNVEAILLNAVSTGVISGALIVGGNINNTLTLHTIDLNGIVHIQGTIGAVAGATDPSVTIQSIYNTFEVVGDISHSVHITTIGDNVTLMTHNVGGDFILNTIGNGSHISVNNIGNNLHITSIGNSAFQAGIIANNVSIGVIGVYNHVLTDPTPSVSFNGFGGAQMLSVGHIYGYGQLLITGNTGGGVSVDIMDAHARLQISGNVQGDVIVNNIANNTQLLLGYSLPSTPHSINGNILLSQNADLPNNVSIRIGNITGNVFAGVGHQISSLLTFETIGGNLTLGDIATAIPIVVNGNIGVNLTVHSIGTNATMQVKGNIGRTLTVHTMNGGTVSVEGVIGGNVTVEDIASGANTLNIGYDLSGGGTYYNINGDVNIQTASNSGASGADIQLGNVQGNHDIFLGVKGGVTYKLPVQTVVHTGSTNGVKNVYIGDMQNTTAGNPGNIDFGSVNPTANVTIGSVGTQNTVTIHNIGGTLTVHTMNGGTLSAEGTIGGNVTVEDIASGANTLNIGYNPSGGGTYYNINGDVNIQTASNSSANSVNIHLGKMSVSYNIDLGIGGGGIGTEYQLPTLITLHTGIGSVNNIYLTSLQDKIGANILDFSQITNIKNVTIHTVGTNNTVIFNQIQNVLTVANSVTEELKGTVQTTGNVGSLVVGTITGGTLTIGGTLTTANITTMNGGTLSVEGAIGGNVTVEDIASGANTLNIGYDLSGGGTYYNINGDVNIQTVSNSGASGADIQLGNVQGNHDIFLGVKGGVTYKLPVQTVVHTGSTNGVKNVYIGDMQNTTAGNPGNIDFGSVNPTVNVTIGSVGTQNTVTIHNIGGTLTVHTMNGGTLSAEGTIGGNVTVEDIASGANTLNIGYNPSGGGTYYNINGDVNIQTASNSGANSANIHLGKMSVSHNIDLGIGGGGIGTEYQLPTLITLHTGIGSVNNIYLTSLQDKIGANILDFSQITNIKNVTIHTVGTNNTVIFNQIQNVLTVANSVTEELKGTVQTTGNVGSLVVGTITGGTLTIGGTLTTANITTMNGGTVNTKDITNTLTIGTLSNSGSFTTTGNIGDDVLITTMNNSSNFTISGDITAGSLTIPNISNIGGITITGRINGNVTLAGNADMTALYTGYTFSFGIIHGNLTLAQGHSIGSAYIPSIIKINVGTLEGTLTTGHIMQPVSIHIKTLTAPLNTIAMILGPVDNSIGYYNINETIKIDHLTSTGTKLLGDFIQFTDAFEGILAITNMNLSSFNTKSNFSIFAFSGANSTGSVELGISSTPGTVVRLFDSVDSAFDASNGNNYLMRGRGGTNITGVIFRSGNTTNTTYKFQVNKPPVRNISIDGTRILNEWHIDKSHLFDGANFPSIR